MGGKKILIADDEQPIRSLVKELLRNKYIVLEATNGEIAVDIASSQIPDIARRNKPDLILMDIMMPKMDGYTACSKIKTDQVTKGIPVVMLNGLGHELNKRIAEQIGADGYITKPFSLQDLLDVIGRLLTAT